MKFTKLLATAALSISSMTAFALPMSNAESFYLTDANGVDDSFFTFNWSGSTSNSFGIYDFTQDNLGNVTVTSTLTIFDASTSNPFSFINFDLNAGTATSSNSGDVADIDESFGFYIENTNGTFYSHADLNGGTDYLNVYLNSLQGTLQLNWEDTLDNDSDFNDLEILVEDVSVSEPGTLALLGLGLAGLGFARRRQSAA